MCGCLNVSSHVPLELQQMLNTQFFALDFTAAHLKPRISLDNYKRIFETVWQDRASNAGWSLDVQYAEDHRVTFHFKR
jgi:hypothetical protein